MKRLLVPIALLALAGMPASTQAQGGIGIKGGLSYGTANNNGVDPGATQRSGFAIGIGASSSGLIGFGIEGLYAQRGFTSPIVGASRRLDYIDVPVYLRVSLPNPLVAPFAYVGPQGSYELNCNNGGSGNCPDTGRPKLTYAGVIGAGVRLGALGGLSVEGRYIYGLSDLNMSTVQSSSSYKTRSLLLLLGFGM